MNNIFINLLLEDEDGIFLNHVNIDDITDMDEESVFNIKQKLSSFGIDKSIISELAMMMKHKGVRTGLKWGHLNGFFIADNYEKEEDDIILGIYTINNKIFAKYSIPIDIF